MEGFYERGRFFRLRDSGLMMAAGLYDDWEGVAGLPIRSCTMITTTPNELVAMAHDRMPGIVARHDWAQWLGEVLAAEAEIQALMRPYPADLMTTGSARNLMRPEGIKTPMTQGSLF